MPLARAGCAQSLWDRRSPAERFMLIPHASALTSPSADRWQQIGHHVAWCLATDRRTVVAGLKKGRVRSERRQSRAGRVR